jgi:hypothetical protein
MRQHQRLLKAFETACIPPGLENVSWWKLRLSVDLATVHITKTAQWLFAEFRTPADWLSYFPDLNLLDFTFQARVLAMPRANLDALHSSIATEWDQWVAEYICRTCHSF